MLDSISSRISDTAFATCTSFIGLLAQIDSNGPTGIYRFVSQGVLVFLSLIAVIALAIFLGHFIAKKIRMEEYGTRLSVILGSIAIAFMILAANNFTPRFGIDLRGGINMIGSLNLDSEEPEEDLFLAQTTTTAEQIIPILLRRVDPAGTSEIMIRPLGTDKIEVTIPTNSKAEADEIWTRLVKTGKLQFLIMAERQFSKHNEARRLATELAAAGSLSRNVGEVIRTIDGQERKLPLARWFSLALEDDKGQSLIAYKMIPDSSQLLRDSRTGRLVPIDTIPITSRDEEIAAEQFTAWWQENHQGSPQILLMEPDSESMRVEGKHLNANALKIGIDEVGRDSVNFEMTAEGSSRMFDFTWEHKEDAEGKYRMAIVLDNQVHTAPYLEDTISTSGRITGNFSRQEIDDLIISLRSGNIDVALNDNPISSQFIESALGQELKEKGLIAIGASFILVLIFMVIYYRFAGIVAMIALLLNLVFIMALVMAIQQPLTLTGLAGLVLTIGMSVDANILIFERIREELDKGAALRMAIRNGFDKATTTIVDANVTTLITAIVLYVIGTEQIKGFSVTLILGILISMFTAIYCSRTIFDIWERKRWITGLNMTRMFGKLEFDFIGWRFLTGIPSIILIGIGIAAMFGLQEKILHHDLRGGSTLQVVFNEPPGSADGSQDGRQFVLDKLKAEDLHVNDEEIEYSVSKLSSDLFPNRVFKIDSNLPSYDGDGEPPYEELAPLIGRVFKDQLELLNVRVAESPVNAEAQPDSLDTGAHWRNIPSIFSAINITRPIVILNSTFQDEQGTGSSPDSPDSESNSTESDGLTVENQTKSLDAIEAAENPTISQENDTADTDSDSLVTDNNAADQADQKLSEISTALEFKFPVSGKELRTFIIAAGDRAEVEIVDEQIELASPDTVEESAINSLLSKNWTVKMSLPDGEQAKEFFEGWAADFNSTPYFPTSSAVGGQIAKDTQIQALVAIAASFLGIIAYVWIRFQNVAFGLAAVIALIHDVLIVLGAIAISQYIAGWFPFLLLDDLKISLPVIAALLTVIGYSINDTIVIFDRMREVRGKRSELNAEIANVSISQTLSRTFLTAFTTFVVVFILYCFGGEAIHGFAFAMCIGVVVGTYSSVFIAAPVLLWLMNSVGLNPGEPAKADMETA